MNGSFTFRAAYNSQMLDDIGYYLNLHDGTFLFDLEKFYDNVDVHHLISFGEYYYPTKLLSLGLMMHMTWG